MKNRLSKRILSLCLAFMVMFTTIDPSLVYATDSTTESSAETTENNETEEKDSGIATEESGNDKATEAEIAESDMDGKVNESKVLSPVFDANTEVDDTRIHVTAPEGVFPEGSTVKAEKVTDEIATEIGDKIADTIEANENVEKNVAKSYTFDIKVLDKDGVEIQPDIAHGKVNISFDMKEVTDENVKPAVYHVDNDYNVKELQILEKDPSLNDESAEDKSISVETDGFSYYTIEFSYESKQYVLNGDTEVKMDDVIESVGLSGTVEAAESSNNDLLSVRQSDDGTWYVKANSAFATEETLNVTIRGLNYQITVTNAANIEERSISLAAEEPAESQLYAILYESGELHFQYGDQADSAKGTATNTYKVEDAYTKYYDIPWRRTANNIKSVTSDAITCPTSMAYWFYECYYLTSIDLSKFDTSNVTNMSCMFGSCRGLTSIDLSGLNTSKVTAMSGMFGSCSGLTSIDLSGFDTSNVTDMSYMFGSCSGLTSIDLSGLNTSKVTAMSGMFGSCSGLTSIDLSGFDTSNVTDMSSMFYNCSRLTSINLSGLNTSKVTNMGYMFYNCSGLTGIDLSGFDTSKVTNMRSMFDGCSGLTSINLSGFDTSNVTDMSDMFEYCSGLTSIDLSGLNTSKVTAMSGMFGSCSGLTSIDLSGFDTSKVTDLSSMFHYCSGLTSIDLSGFDTSNVTDMRHMFNGCSRLTSIDLSGFDTSNVTNMSYMFYACSGLTSIDLSGLNANKVTDMGYMFGYCSGLTSIDLSRFDTSNVTGMGYMFYNCSGLTSIDLSGCNANKVRDMGYMFSNCSGLTSIDLSGLNTSNVTDMRSMFYNCSGLTSIDLSGFDTSNVTDMRAMFYNCRGLTSIDLSGLNANKVTDMGYMFEYCSGLTSINLSGLSANIVTDMGHMFYYCRGLTSIDLSGFDTSNVRDMDGIFVDCNSLVEITLGTNWKFVGDKNCLPTSSWRKKGTGEEIDPLWQKYNGETMAGTYECISVILYENGELHFQYGAEPKSKSDGKVLSRASVADEGEIKLTLDWKFYVKCVKADETIHFKSMKKMFYNCFNLESVDFTNCDTSQVTDMSSMFESCRSTRNIALKGLDTTNVKNMSRMFYYCWNLRYLDLSDWTISKDCNLNEMFLDCSNLAAIKLGENWSFNKTNCLPSHNWIRYSTKEMIESLEQVYDGKTMADTYCLETKCKFNANGGLFNKTVSYYILDRFGDDIVVAEPTRWGYIFDGWYNAETGGDKLKPGDMLIERQYYAHWISNNYDLILKSNGTEEADIKVPMKADTFYQLSDQLFHKAGYVLSGWNTKRNGSGKAFGANEYVGKLVDNESKEYILYAQWTPVSQYATVSFETGNGSPIESYQVLKGSKLGKLPKSLKEGYTFINWHIGSIDGAVPDSSTVITEDTVLYAEFKKNPTVTFDGDGQVEKQTRQLRYNETIGELPTYKVSKDCPMTLIGWFTEKTGGDAINANTRVTEDVTYYAHWGWKPNFNADGGIILSDTQYPVQESKEYRFGKDCPLPTVKRDGYEFLGWFGDNYARKIEDGETVDLSQYPEIRAKWRKLKTYTVSLDANGGTYREETLKILKDSSNEYGILQGLGKPTRSEYKFIGWMDKSGKYYQNGDHITSDLKLTAQWQKMDVTVTFDPQEGTMFGSKSRKIVAGETLNTIPGAKKDNMYLEGWYTEQNGQGERLEKTTIISEDVTYYAFYKPVLNSKESNKFYYTFGAEWTNANSRYVDNYNNNLEWHCDSYSYSINSGLRFRYELNKSDGTNKLPTGAVQIKVPKYIWKDWDGKWIGTTNIAENFTEYPTKGRLIFSYIDGNKADQYSFLKDEENASDYYYIINNQPMEGGMGLEAIITYSVPSAYNIPGGAAYMNGSDWEYIAGYPYYKGEVPVEVKIDTDFDIDKPDRVFQADMRKTLKLTNEMHTYVDPSVSASSPTIESVWNSSWGEKPEDADDYFYVVWSWYSYFYNSAPFSAEWSEDTVHDGTVVKLFSPKYNSTGQNSSFYTSAIIKYPKTLLENKPETGLVLKNAAILKTTWKSGYKTEQLVSNSITIRDAVDSDTRGFKKTNCTSSSSYDYVRRITEGQKELMDDQTLSMYWELSYSGPEKEDAVWDKDKKTFRMPNYRIELVDGKPGDIMYSTGGASYRYAWKPDKGNVELNDNDYQIKEIRVELGAWYPEYIGNTCVNIKQYKTGQKYFDLYLRYADSPKFVYYDTYSLSPGGNKSIRDIPSNVVGYKVQLESDYYKTTVTTTGEFEIKPTEHIKSLVSTDYWKETTSIFKDQSTCKVEWKDEEKKGTILNATNNTGGKTDASKVIYELIRATQQPSSNAYQYTKKTASSTPRVDVAKGVQDSYISISGWNYKTYSGSDVEPITSGIFYDLLPAGTTVDEDTISGYYVTGNYSNSNMPSGSRLKKELYHVRFEENWENSNRTMMIIDCNSPSDVKSAGFRFDYMLRNSFGNIIENGTSVENDVAFVNTSTNRSVPRGKEGSIDIIKEKEYYKFLSDNTENVPFTTYASAIVNYRKVNAFSWGVNKSVKSDSTDGLYEKENAIASAKSEYTYCLEFSQSDGARSSELVFYDVLEQGATITEKGEKKTITSNWHGVLKDINVEAIAKKASINDNTITCKPVIYYSTKNRDSFTESDYDIGKSTIWSSKKPSDLSKVTAIAVDCSTATDGSDFVFSNKETLPIYVTMVAPYDEKGFDKSAYNTVTVFAKQGDDTEARSLTSYSQMVLKDINPDICIVTVPKNGTEQEPTHVLVDTGIDYDLNVKNTDEGLPAKDVKVEYTIPEGLYLDYSNMKFALDNSSGDLISNSPMITVKREGQKLTFVIKRLAAGQTGHIIVPTTVIAERKLFITQASITNVNGVDKNIESNKTYHESVPMPAENPKAIVKKVNKNGDILGGAQLQITGRTVYESEDITPIIWTTEEDKAKEISLEPGNYVLHEVSAPEGYVLNTSDISFEINDKDVELEVFNSEATTLQIEKEWNDGADGKGRPDSVDFEIYQDGEYLKDVTVTKADDWKLTVNGLAKYRADATHDLCVYTVKEKSDGYIANYGYSADLENQSVKIINTKVKTLSGTKKWYDNNESDLERPASITVQLLQDGNEYKTQTVTALEDWKYEFTGNPMYDASGREYVYTIKEAYMEGYSVSYEKTNGGGLAITLDYQTESTSYDWIYVYYKKDDQLYRSPKYGGSTRRQTTLNIPSTEFWIQFRTDGSSSNFYGFKVTNVQLSDNVSELPGSTEIHSNELPASELVNDWNSIESDHYAYPNNFNKCWNYVFKGAGSSERVDIVNTKLTDKYTKVQFKKVDKDDPDKNLANAHLQLLDTDRNVIQDWITGEEPEMFNAIAPGNYVLHEESAPDGYRIAADMNITIEDTTEVQTFTMIDELEKNVALSVSQTVKGSGGNKNKAFNFNLQLTGGTDYPAELQYTITESGQEDVTGTMTLDGGVGSFTLKHGQTITFAEIPNGLHYNVQELDGESQGYTVTYTNASGILDEDQKVDVVNEKNISVPTLAHMNTSLSLVLVILAIVGIAYLSRKRKKQ